MANKSIYLLVMKNDNSSFDIQGVFSTLEKAERIIMMDFYGGSCPRDTKDFESVNKRKATPINGSTLITYYLITKAVSPYAIIETNLDKDSSVIAVENVTINEKKVTKKPEHGYGLALQVAKKISKRDTNKSNKDKELAKQLSNEIKESAKKEKELAKQLQEAKKLQDKLAKELAATEKIANNKKSKLDKLKATAS